MDLRSASRTVAYGRRWRILFCAVLFPLPLLLTLIGSLRQEWSLGGVLTLIGSVGIYFSLILFLVAPVC